MEKSNISRTAHTKDIVRKIFAEAVREVFTEGIKPAPEHDVHGILGFPFDKYIVRGSVQMDDHEERGEAVADYSYMWKLLIPVDSPDILANLDESQETFEEKVLETISKRLRSETKPGGQYTTGFAEVESRPEMNGKKFLLIKVEMTIGWDV